MGRSFPVTAAAALFGAFLAGAVHAGIPDPALSDIDNVIASPGGSLAYSVTILGSDGPVEDAIVRLVFSAEVQPLVCWCSGQVQPEISATTNASGVATFHVAAGGCFDPAQFNDPPVQVFANGILMDEVGMVSPDAVDSGGLFPWQPWNLGATCGAGLPDAVAHTGPIKSGAYSFCTDLNSDGAVGILDAVMVTPSIKAGAFCPR